MILVVDDEPGVAALCQRLLMRAGYQARSVTDPREGIVFLTQQRADLLLVDIRMPGMDGFELMALARRRQPDLAVVVMTGFGTVETALEALRQGADGLIMKPFSQGNELVQSVQHALEENRRKRDALRLQALRPLFDVSRSLFSETHPDRLQDLLIDALRGYLNCLHAGLYAAKPDGGVRLLLGRGKVLDSGAFDAGGALAEVQHGQALCIHVEGPLSAAQRELLLKHQLGSLVCAPMRLRDGQQFLVAARPENEPPLVEADLEMLQILSHQAAVALENARLYEELREYVRQVEESQRMLVQAEKMVTAGRLTASIAHEINNPLQAVRNCLHLAGRAELDSQQREEYLQLAQGELERLMNTVQRMLDLYRPGAVERRLTDLNDLINKVLRLVEQQLHKANVQIHAQLSPRCGAVLVVRDQIQQVLLNLILNAMEAMPNGGDLWIETRQRKRQIEITIEDSGEGVLPELRERIFEPFISTKENGTGLGLTVSFGIITAHGGGLELVKGRGNGASFRITLPLGER